ncbi:tetratricopeptide repeat protein [Flavobacterium sp. MC2016-06]|uniref:tetratricopeptide repeat protein n=1 Tax=Flavobacterium sp. MC2016-06 TaxID=2676308 RepID=UPI0012BAB625|nr:tetratricopeptide repeat protein [Flavobacterium sp. MC2016-06]MBU3859557.1 tetratricopeptide repeat protein [Flavobacterium sp. MC2016-06]
MNEERYILFDQYLQGEMNVEERTNFEKQLAEDAALASELETFKEMHFQLENKFKHEAEREAFTANLTKISDKHFNNNTKPKVLVLKPWYYAVASSVAVLFGLFFFNYDQNPSFADFNHPEKAYFTERGATIGLLKVAETAYNTKNYGKAVNAFEQILKVEKTPEIQYFYGVSLLEENQFKKAETIFIDLKAGTSVYKEKATWNLALSKLKQKDYKGCKEILQTISQDYENYDDVEELLDALN